MLRYTTVAEPQPGLGEPFTSSYAVGRIGISRTPPRRPRLIGNRYYE